MAIFSSAVSAVRKRWKAAALVIATVAVAITAGVVSAQASIPDSNGVIHACYRNTTGELRVIDTGSGGSCYTDETALSWPSASLQYFTGTTEYFGGNPGHFSVTCPDNGIPVSLWPGINGNYETPTLITSGGVPDGLNQPYYGGSSSFSGFAYTLICS